MASTLIGTGVCSYNGVNFVSPYLKTLSLDAKPVYDAAGRTVAYVVYTISLQTLIYATNPDAGDTTDGSLASLRVQLTQPGGELRYESKGFGTLSANGSASAKDVRWGPKPQLLRWAPVGNDKAAEITWTVEVAIPECSNAQYAFALMEYNFKVSVDNDTGGYGRRNWSGHLTIPQTRGSVSTRSLSDTADAYLEQATPDLPAGFRRVSSHHELSEDKCRLDFSFEDEEMPQNAPPPGCVEASASHTMASFAQDTSRWTGTLTASYEIAKGLPRSLAWKCFRDFSNGRLSQMPAGANFLIVGLTLAEPEVHGRKTASFSLTYTIATSIANILKGSGLWTPTPGGDWATWINSLPSNLKSPRGNAQLFFNPGQDSLVDLCQSPASNQASGSGILTGLGDTTASMQNAYPDPGNSWLYYRNDVMIEQDDENVELKTLPLAILTPGQSSLTNGGMQTTGSDAATMTSVTPPSVPPNATWVNLVSQRANPTLFIRFVGGALRAGYQIPIPKLTSASGAPAIPDNVPNRHFFRSGQIANYGGVPVTRAVWNLRWRIPAPQPGTVLDLPETYSDDLGFLKSGSSGYGTGGDFWPKNPPKDNNGNFFQPS